MFLKVLSIRGKLWNPGSHEKVCTQVHRVGMNAQSDELLIFQIEKGNSNQSWISWNVQPLMMISWYRGSRKARVTQEVVEANKSSQDNQMVHFMVMILMMNINKPDAKLKKTTEGGCLGLGRRSDFGINPWRRVSKCNDPDMSRPLGH